MHHRRSRLVQQLMRLSWLLNLPLNWPNHRSRRRLRLPSTIRFSRSRPVRRWRRMPRLKRPLLRPISRRPQPRSHSSRSGVRVGVIVVMAVRSIVVLNVVGTGIRASAGLINAAISAPISVKAIRLPRCRQAPRRLPVRRHHLASAVPTAAGEAIATGAVAAVSARAMVHQLQLRRTARALPPRANVARPGRIGAESRPRSRAGRRCQSRSR